MENQQNVYPNINQAYTAPVVIQPAQTADYAVQENSDVSCIQVTTNFQAEVASGAMVPVDSTIVQNGTNITHAQGDCSIYLAPNGTYLCTYRTTCYYGGKNETQKLKTGLHVNGSNYPGSTASCVIPRCTGCDMTGTCIINVGTGVVNVPLGIRNRSSVPCFFLNTTITIVKIG